MDQLIYASLSHTHYWYEVGILKVSAILAGVDTESSEVIQETPHPLFFLLSTNDSIVAVNSGPSCQRAIVSTSSLHHRQLDFVFGATRVSDTTWY